MRKLQVQLTPKKLYSITPLVSENVRETMMKPILVFCSDLEYYYCKYKRSHYGDELFNEYLGASFLKIWELGVPDFALVEIHQEHIPIGLHADIQPFYFGAPCFGSKYSRSYSEVDLISHQLSDSQKRTFKRRNEILEIALFDLWVANEDRNVNNYNLLFDVANENRILPIDHQFIFNSNSLRRGLSQLTETDSLIYTPFFTSLFGKRVLADENLLRGIEDKFYLCTQKCRSQLDRILAAVPKEWNLGLEEKRQMLETSIFSPQWIEECWKHFQEYISEAINRM